MGSPRVVGSLRTERRLGVKGQGFSREVQFLFRELHKQGWLTSSRKASLHALIILRDGINCWLCNKPVDPQTISVDHVIPISHLKSLKLWKKHKIDYDNLRIAHRRCNSKRGNMMPNGKHWNMLFPSAGEDL